MILNRDSSTQLCSSDITISDDILGNHCSSFSREFTQRARGSSLILRFLRIQPEKSTLDFKMKDRLSASVECEIYFFNLYFFHIIRLHTKKR